jgi:hypothetical protein
MGEVAGQIMGSLEGGLAKGDTVVIWLLDRSISMKRQHEILAVELEQQLTTLHEGFAENPRHLMHAAVAFGGTTQELLASTPRPHALMTAFRAVPVDESGIENVCGAIQQCLQQYVIRRPKFRDRQFLFVVLTDESGDDTPLLEETIALCQKYKVRVDVIGPSAVLGQRKGYHLYVHPQNQLLYYLPVARGPDSGMPERLDLPYWFRNVPEGWNESARGPWQGAYVGWLGGSNLESIVSGFSPYALTRLTRETGGQYTIFDRPGDRSPFTMGRLRRYLPDYRSIDEIQVDLRQEQAALRRTVLAAASVTWNASDRLQPPRLRIGGSNIAPGEFVSLLQRELPREIERSRDALLILEQALSAFDSLPAEQAYEQEPSARWRAWYDLTRGRLMAVSVRYQEYVLICQQILAEAQRLGVGPNLLTFYPSAELLNPRTSGRFKEADQLLQRCVQEHQGTPWQYLAERELAEPLSVRFQLQTLPPPRPVGPVVRPPEVSLPNL